jgi:hypothetical protein
MRMLLLALGWSGYALWLEHQQVAVFFADEEVSASDPALFLKHHP